MGMIPAISLVILQARVSQDHQCRSLSVYALVSGMSATSVQMDAHWELWKQPRPWPGPVSMCPHPLEAKARPFPAVRAPVVHSEVPWVLRLQSRYQRLQSGNSTAKGRGLRFQLCSQRASSTDQLDSIPRLCLRAPPCCLHSCNLPEVVQSPLGARWDRGCSGRPFPSLCLCS